MSQKFLDLDVALQKNKNRIIHQIWFGTIPNKSEAKKAYKKLHLYRDSWILKNPSWPRVEWSKDLCISLVKTYYPEHMEMFKKYPYEIQRCDAIRYLILHRYGGIYADMDYYCNRPFDEALSEYKNDIYFVQSPNSLGDNNDHISNSLMYSRDNNPFWRVVMLELEKNQVSPKYYSKHVIVMYSTGPGILNRVYNRYKYQYRVKSLPYKLFHPFGIGDEKTLLKSNKDVFAIHLGKGSWEEKDSKFFLFFYTNWRLVLFIILSFLIPFSILKIILSQLN